MTAAVANIDYVNVRQAAEVRWNSSGAKEHLNSLQQKTFLFCEGGHSYPRILLLVFVKIFNIA